MLRKSLLTLMLAIALGAGFVYGLIHLFVLRYEVGDVYPPYSSLRADPLGTKALAEALDELPGVEVSRNFKPLPKLHPSGPVTLVYTGTPHSAYWSDPELAAFEALVLNGSRAVFSFFPIENKPDKKEEENEDEAERAKKRKRIKKETPEAERKKKKEEKKAEEQKKPEEKKEADKPESEEEDKSEYGRELVSFGDVSKRWGFTFDYLPEEKKAYDRHAALVEPGGLLEPDISWHSALYFRDLKPQWKVLYMCGTMPVVIERKYGQGSLILVADSYFLSNEALRKERHPKLLARLFSGPPAVIFDEESRGLRENPGIASLVRKYRLHGAVAGILLIGVFFVWKNAVRFIPAYEPEIAERDVVAGKESSEGFINLLRRSIRPAALFDTCVAEWRKTFAHRPRELARIEEIVARYQASPARERDPIATYHAISEVIARK